ncbi:MAG: hypothetical protein ACP5TZ_05820, partial [Nitrososphaeria archaeon]
VTPTANESPYLRPLFNQIIYLYKMVKLMTADAGYISRENCDVIGSAGTIPRIFPKKNVPYWDPWREMIFFIGEGIVLLSVEFTVSITDLMWYCSSHFGVS